MTWARGLIQMQSGVKLRLYVKCREGEEVCEKRDCLSPCHFFFFSFFLFVIMHSLFWVQKASCSASYGENKTYKSKH